MMRTSLLVFIAVLPVLVYSSYDELSYYQFSATLKEDYYTLYWNFSAETNRTWFAVEVQTTGWVGFGLSPNGQMPQSDVVIGWVDDNNVSKAYFHDRFAEGRYTPPIDPIQNWFLTSATQENGTTVLQFYRDFITCDDRDIDILFETAHVVYSWNDNDPVVTVGEDGTETYTFERHQDKGSTSINILGGLPNRPSIPDNAQSFTIAVNGITIPSNPTTYWCAVVELDDAIQQTEQYIIKYSPSLTPGNEALVHHIVVYLCDGVLEDVDLGPGSVCDYVSDRVAKQCLSGGVLTGWAVGGEGFFFPGNVAQPFGGPGHPKYVMIEMHYNNEEQLSGVSDSSGVTVTYISTPREYDAGLLEVGHRVTSNMIIPPRTQNYTISSICSSACTEAFFPDEGINIFGNLLHSHLAGIGLRLTKLEEISCSDNSSRLKETVVDQNLHYDFNFQQTVHFPQIIHVDKGESFYLECYYDTMDRSGVTLGGESTQKEMCLSFFYYYPKMSLSYCNSFPTFNKFNDFIKNQVPREYQSQFEALTDIESTNEMQNTLNLLDWNQEQIDALKEYIYVEGTQTAYCYSPDSSDYYSGDLEKPSVCCPQTPREVDVCTGSVPESCCARTCPLQSRDIDPNAAPGMGASLLLLLLCLLLVTVVLF